MKKGMLSLFTVFLFVMLFACSRTEDIDPNYIESDYGLASIRNEAELRALTKVHESSGFFNIFSRFFGAMREMEDGATDDLDGGGDEEHSETNVQVEGIDEGDIVKTDGNRIYQVHWNTLRVIEVSQGAMQVVLEEARDEYGAWYSELYITDDYFVVIGYHYEWGYLDHDGDVVESDDNVIRPSMGWFGRSMTMIDIYDKATLEVVKQYEISGSLRTSRLIDNTLVLISVMDVPNYRDVDPRPYIRQDDDVWIPEYSDIKYVQDTMLRTYTLITTIVFEEEITEEMDIFLGSFSWGQIYVSKRGIYMESSYYDYNRNAFKRYLVSYLFDDDYRTSYGGHASFDGYIINQFAMDEYNGYVRLVTTEGWGESAINRLYIFEHKEEDGKRLLSRVSLLDEGLGKPRETVRSVRFMGDQAIVVTFEQIDPYYIIDLSNPANPTITGELEVSGFSTYLHPWHDNYMIGLGYESSGMGIDGIKLSLYDNTNPKNPVEVGSSLVFLNDQSYSFSEALHNHKALLVNRNRDFIGFSMQRYYYYDYYYRWTSDYMIFEVDPSRETPISVRATISHYDLFETRESEFHNDIKDDYYGYIDFSIQRAVFVGDYLYVLSGEAISSHHMDEDFTTHQSIIYRLNE